MRETCLLWTNTIMHRPVPLLPTLDGKDYLCPHMAATQNLPQMNAFYKTPKALWADVELSGHRTGVKGGLDPQSFQLKWNECFWFQS